MKRIIFTFAILFSVISSYATDAIKVMTVAPETTSIEVFIIGHNGDTYTISRNGVTTTVNKKYLKISSETEILIEIADDNKEMYEVGKRISNATSTNSENAIISELILNHIHSL